MRDFKNLEFWKRSHILTLDIYKCTLDFPKHEVFGLTSQIRRSSASVLEYQLLPYKDSYYFKKLNHELIEIRKMMNTYIQLIKSSIQSLTKGLKSND